MRTIMKLSFILIIFILIWQGVLKYGGKGKMEPIPDLAKYGSYYDETWDALIKEYDIESLWVLDSTSTLLDSTLRIYTARSWEDGDSVQYNGGRYWLSASTEYFEGWDRYTAGIYKYSNTIEDYISYFTLQIQNSGSPRFRIYIYNETEDFLVELNAVSTSNNPDRYYLRDYTKTPD